MRTRAFSAFCLLALLHVVEAEHPHRGYQPVIGSHLLLDGKIAQPEVLMDAGVTLLRGDALRPEGSVRDAKVFAITKPKYRPRAPVYKQTTWHVDAELKLPINAVGYNRTGCWVYVEGARFGQVTFALEPRGQVSSQLPRRKYGHYVGSCFNVPAGQWHSIVLDFPYAEDPWKSKVTGITLRCGYAYPQKTEDRQQFRLLVSGVRLEQVTNPRKWRGWGADPQVITVNQVGYKPLSEKIALADPSSGLHKLEVKEVDTDQVVLTGSFRKLHSPLGEFLVADFTTLDTPGRYYLSSGSLSSVAFTIEDRPYTEVAKALMRCLYDMRCGTATPLHEACHLDAMWDPGLGRFVDLVGGYHDAADMCRFDHSQTCEQLSWHMRSHDLLPEGDPLRRTFFDEARWCMKIVQKHMDAFGRIVFVTEPHQSHGNFLTDNIPGTGDDWLLSGRSAHGFFPRSIDGLTRIAAAARTSHPEVARKALDLVRASKESWARFGCTSAALAAYRALPEDDPLRESARTGAFTYASPLVRHQENRVFRGSAPAFSGVFSRWKDQGRYRGPRPGLLRACHVPGLVDLMEACPSHPDWYRWYFALRRYADFYVKSGYQYTAPYVMPVAVVRKDQAPKLKLTPVGSLDGQDYYCPELGKELTGNNGITEAWRTVYTWMQAAAALGDPAVENRALALWSWNLGLNPFNWIRIMGFGEDPCRAVQGNHQPGPGPATTYPNSYYFNRYVPLAHFNEIWTNTQTLLAMNAVCLDAPCQVWGRVTSDRKPYTGKATIGITKGRVFQSFATREDGTYGPVLVPGGGYVELTADGVTRTFPAIAGARYEINLDTDHEAVIERTPTLATGAELPVRNGFPHFRAGEPYKLRLRVAPLGRQRSRHALTFHAANADVVPARAEVSLDPGEPRPVEVTITPQTAGETLCVLAVLDGDRTRKWEMSAVAE